jgi:hypothetical protein
MKTCRVRKDAVHGIVPERLLEPEKIGRGIKQTTDIMYPSSTPMVTGVQSLNTSRPVNPLWRDS